MTTETHPETGASAPASASGAAAASPPRLADVPRWITLGLVPVVALVALVTWFAWRPAFDYLIGKKEGPIAYATVLAALTGVAFGLGVIRYRRHLPARWLRAWVVVLPLGLFYMAGEELSWGQHVFGWQTPQRISRVNRQDETNLHNHEVIGRFVGRKPKQVVEVWTIVGCIIAPLVIARRPRRLDPRLSEHYWFWPTFACTLSAALATIVYLPTRISRLVYGETPSSLRLSELQEFYFALTLALYVGSLYVRLRDMDRKLGPAASAPEPGGAGAPSPG